MAATPELVPWGKNFRMSITDEVATFFYKKPLWTALEDARHWAEKNKGHLESARGIFQRRSQEHLGSPSWQWLTANYEEIVGLDLVGRVGKKGEPVLVAIQGGGIMLSSPERLQTAYINRTRVGEPSLSQDEITRVLKGTLPNWQTVTGYTLHQLARENPEELPQTYVIVIPLKDLEGTPSGRMHVGELPNNKIFIARAGHPQIAEDYATALRNAGVREYGNRHTLKLADPKNPSGRVLHMYSNRTSNLIPGDYHNGSARFVGVRQAAGAEGAGPPQAGSLDELMGKAIDVGQGILVINAKNISQSAYKALTGSQ